MLIAQRMARFNPRARTGRDARHRRRSSRHHSVSIHAPVRGATFLRACCRRCSHGFNPRARTGRDPSTRLRQQLTQAFQSTRPYGARRRSAGLHPVTSFNPRARTGRDHGAHRRLQVSIHAPVRGATGHAAVDIGDSTFQSTRPCGARRAVGCSLQHVRTFQSTRPYGARLTRLLYAMCKRRFNPRARTGRDATAPAHTCWAEFQSTRPYGARRHRRSPDAPSTCSFNPRARTGRDVAVRADRCDSNVSIHAPVRGATLRDLHVPQRSTMVSIHAPVRGATAFRLSVSVHDSFNPRARTGRDDVIHEPRRHEHVSIHAPVRGATSCDRAAAPLIDVSIHAPVRGATIAAEAHQVPMRVSIHAPVRGATSQARALLRRSINVSIHAPVRGATTRADAVSRRDQLFQSTRPYGARQRGLLRAARCTMVSIHAPVRGATRRTDRDHVMAASFNPRARTGRDARGQLRWRADEMFQSTRPYGARRAHRRYRREIPWFQSTRPYGARRARRLHISVSDRVSIHAPVRGATMSTTIACECR